MATMHANMKATTRFEPLEPWAATRRRKGAGLFAARAIVALVLLCSVLLAAWPAHAQERDFTPRFHATVPGDIVMIGNITQNCAGYTQTPSADCATTRTHKSPNGSRNNNDFGMLYTRVDSGAQNNNSSATLEIPNGATVLFAGLYWASVRAEAEPARSYIQFRTPGGDYERVNATQVDDRVLDGRRAYQGIADVTDKVIASGSGVYSAGDIPGLSNGKNAWGGWALVVAYRMPGLPLRDLAVYDGWKYAGSSVPLFVDVDGFTTPLSGPVESRLGVLAWDGDRNETDGVGGGLQFGPDRGNLSVVSDAMNPADNFWNSTISIDGRLVDTGMTPNYFNTLGMDMDTLVPAVQLPNGATSAVARLNGTPDETIFIGMVNLVNDAYLPSLDDRLKASKIEDASGKLYPGGVLTYTIEATNKGSAAATDVVVTDEIPEGTTYVPGSLKILENSSGPTGNMGDGISSDGDQAAYDGASTNKRVIFWLGAGGGPNKGGSVAQGDTIKVQFQVKVDDDAEDGDKISNQAQYDYFAQQLQTTVQDESDADLDTEDINEPTINDVVGKSADLAITKSSSVDSVGNGGTVEYTLAITNDEGPDAGDGAVVTDPKVTGIDCPDAPLVCEADAGAACPAAADATVGKLQAAGVTIPTLPKGGKITFRMSCKLSVTVP
jgi:uncharacterized repeat protein (TIGR01451 family)